MNKILPILLALVAIGLGAGLVAQRGAVRDLRRQLAAQEQRQEALLAGQQTQLAQVREQNEVFKSESEQLRTKLAERLAEKTAAVAAPGAAAGPGVATADGKGEGGNWMKGLAKMFTDPEMKKSMRAQQAFGIRMMYGDLAKELGLSLEEANLVFDLLAERQMELSAKALGGDGAVDNPEANAAAAKKASEYYDGELANILGKDRMKKFKDYERTGGERMTMMQYQQSLSAAGAPLEEGQRQTLLGIMTEERLKQQPTVLDPGNKDVAGAMRAMRTGEGLAEAMEKQRELNQRVLTRARSILTADQTTAFEAAQKQMLEMQEMGLKMSKAMMGGGETGGAGKK